ncbi:MAG: hypothetical protein WDO74_10550 [Pseudomonadota bacterium]
MKLKRFSIGTLGLLAVSGLAWSCSGKSEDCNANLNCGPYGGGTLGTSGASGAAGASSTSGKGGASGTSGTGTSGTGTSGNAGASGEGGTDPTAGAGGVAPPMCNGSLSPDLDACVISDEYGIFVAPNQDASADGTQAHPYATLTTALANVMKIKHVYVCAADYAEPDTIEIPDRVSIYGGFTCEGGVWKYDSALPAHLLPKSPIGARITDAKVGVVIQDVRIDAGNAPDDGTGASSFGMMISGSQNIALKRVEIRAGKGGKGKAGIDGATGLDGIASGTDQNGKAGTCDSAPSSRTGPVPVPKICGSEGGVGGTAQVAADYSPTQDGLGGYLVAPSNGGKGGQVFGNGASRGGDGDKGTPGDKGTAAPALGAFSATGYQMASGGSGGAGRPGRGGGGGGASLGAASSTANCLGSTGGAGGMGGCGGDPGGGGIGGGASVGLLSWQSAVTIDSCALTANTGGAGGNGGAAHIGGAGKAGGTGGPTDSANKVGVGGRGGDGGNGGNGGNGAGGSGGPSIALVYAGIVPMRVGAPSLTFASIAAAAGKGGALGSTEDYGPDGAKGLTQDIYPKP